MLHKISFKVACKVSLMDLHYALYYMNYTMNVKQIKDVRATSITHANYQCIALHEVHHGCECELFN